MKSARIRLFSVKYPYTENTEELFQKAMQENVSFHYQHCPEYRKILDSRKFSPEHVTDENGLEKLPFLPTLLFKHHHLFSIPERKLPIKATSSGTKGSFSRIGLDWSSLLCGFLIVLTTAKWRKLLSFRPVNYIILGYQPNHNNQMAVMKTAFGATFFAPALHRVYLESIMTGNSKQNRIFQGKYCSLTACQDSELELSCLYGNPLVKPLPRNQILSVLRRKKGYLQTAGLICPPESQSILTEILIQSGINRIFPAGKMSDTVLGEAHDGEYPLRRYTRIVNTIK